MYYNVVMSNISSQIEELLDSGTSRSVIAQQLGLSKAAISWHCKKLGLKRVTNPVWSKEEIRILSEKYSKLPLLEDLEILLEGRSLASIRRKASELGLKRKKATVRSNSYPRIAKDQRKHCMEILLDNSLISLYYIGLLLSDGSIRVKRGSIRLKLSVKDQQTVLNLREYLKSSNKPYYAIAPSRELCGHTLPESLSISLELRDVKTVQKLCTRFDIKETKTYNPPSNLEGYLQLPVKSRLALLIGFIDGDGTVKVRKDRKHLYSINIRCHQAWKNFFVEFNNSIVEDLGQPFGRITDVSKTNLVSFCIYRRNLIQLLKSIIEKNNLPVLQRKWDKVKVYC